MNNSIYKGWDKPIPYNTYSKPLFNINIFPKWLKEYVNEVAIETQTPIDAAAFASLAVLSTLLGGTYEVNVNNGGWREPLCLFLVLCLEPGNRKSNVFSMLTNRLTNLEKKERKKLLPKIREQEVEIKALKNRIEELQKRYGKTDESSKQNEILSEIKNLERDLVDKEKNMTIEPCFFSSDITVEKLAEEMNKHSGSFAILSSEGAEFFEMAAGRYSGKSNIDLYLKGHSAETIKIDRKNSESIFIEEARLSIGLFVQKSVLQNVPSNFNTRGLMQRFLISFPLSLLGNRDAKAMIVSERVKQQYEMNLDRLFEEIIKSRGERIQLKLSTEAREYLYDVQTEVELLLGDHDSSEEYKGWLGKLVGQIIRIAGLLHVSECIENNSSVSKEISLNTLKQADLLRNYFIKHAEYFFNVELDISKDNENMDYILRKIIKIDKDLQGKIDQNALWQEVKKKIKPAKVLNEYLVILEQKNYIKVLSDGRKKIILLNPYYQKSSPNSPI